MEVPRLRGLDEIGSASPGVHGFKSSGNRFTLLEHARMTKTLNNCSSKQRAWLVVIANIEGHFITLAPI